MDTCIKDKLVEIVGPDSVTDALIDMISYSSDASDHTHRPAAAVWPASSEQISNILRLANEKHFSVIPRGGREPVLRVERSPTKRVMEL